MLSRIKTNNRIEENKYFEENERGLESKKEVVFLKQVNIQNAKILSGKLHF